MAGVNLSEENACILAANSELIGTVIHSCTDEPFLSSEALQNKILNIGEKKAHVADMYGCSVSFPLSLASLQSLKKNLELLRSAISIHVFLPNNTEFSLPLLGNNCALRFSLHGNSEAQEKIN